MFTDINTCGEEYVSQQIYYVNLFNRGRGSKLKDSNSISSVAFEISNILPFIHTHIYKTNPIVSTQQYIYM